MRLYNHAGPTVWFQTLMYDVLEGNKVYGSIWEWNIADNSRLVLYFANQKSVGQSNMYPIHQVMRSFTQISHVVYRGNF